jgi:hypothetical protein
LGDAYAVSNPGGSALAAPASRAVVLANTPVGTLVFIGNPISGTVSAAGHPAGVCGGDDAPSVMVARPHHLDLMNLALHAKEDSSTRHAELFFD